MRYSLSTWPFRRAVELLPFARGAAPAWKIGMRLSHRSSVMAFETAAHAAEGTGQHRHLVTPAFRELGWSKSLVLILSAAADMRDTVDDQP